jgi:phage regulator Rha-like protein
MNGSLEKYSPDYQGEPTMSSREIAELVESRHDNVKRTIETLAERGVITLPQSEEVSNPGHGPRLITVYHLGKRDSYVVVAQLSPEFTGRLVDRWQQLEAQVRNPMRSLSDPAALRALLLSYTEEVLLLQAERDHAIATKAEIGSRREATAMAKASAAVREASKLREQLGESAHLATVTAVEKAAGGSFAWRPLRAWCEAAGVGAEYVQDRRYGRVRTWPAAAWLAVYGIDLSALFGELEAA